LIRDRLAIRLVGYRFNDSGYYRNLAGSDAVLQSTATGFGAQSFAIDDEAVGDTTFTGGRIAALFQVSDDLKFTFTYLRQDIDVDGWVGSNRTGYDQAILRVGPQSRVHGLAKAGQDYEIDLANATMEYDIGWGDVVATYSHIEGESTQAFPFSARPSGVLQLPMVTASFSDHTENSGEIRLATRLDGAWNVLAGLYAEKLEDYWEQPVYWYGNPATSPVALTAVNGDQLFSGAAQWLELEQRSAFSEVSWRFLPDFTLTGGVRYYDYERSVRDASLITGVSSTLDPSNASGTNFRGNVSYKPNPDTLIYAGWSQGFRLGKPQVGLSTTPTCDANGDGIVDGTNLSVASTKDIQSDSVDSYEIGAKFTLLDRLTISGDVFRATWDDIPVQVQQACGAVSVGYTTNAGRARSEGIEVQASYNVTPSLRVDAGASWIRAELTEDVPFQGFRSGDRLPSPKSNASLSLQYAFTMAGRQAYWRADSIYVGGFYSTVGNRIARNAAGDYVKLDTSLRLPVHALNVDLFVHNLLDADDTTYVLNNNTALRLRPRTIGVRVGYDF
jgi:outer membrane receptor protein involved in Fe transport